MGDSAALARLGRAGAEGQDERGVVGGVERGAREGAHADGVGNDHLHLHGAVVAVAAQVTAEAVHEARQRTRRGGAHARRVGDVDRLVAVRVDDALELAGDGVDGLVPADLLELALTALPDALHGVVDAVGVGKPTTVGATAQAGAGLHVLEIPVLGRVRVDPDDLVVFHMELKRATAGAVDGAASPRDLLLGLGGMRRDGSSSEQRISGDHSAARRCKSTQGAARLHERTTTQVQTAIRHSIPLFLSSSIQHGRGRRHASPSPSASARF